jgi:hypothetical protein
VTVHGTARRAPPAHASGRSAWTIVGVTGAGLGLGTAAFGIVDALLGQSQMNSAIDTAGRANATGDADLYMTASKRFSDGSAKRTLGRELIGAGAVLAVVGLVVAWSLP